jgi:putative intracellular protease/amidase
VANELRGKRVAALVDQGFEQSELLEPKKALEQAGAKVDVISAQAGKVRGWKHTEWVKKCPSIDSSTAPVRMSTTRCCSPAAS